MDIKAKSLIMQKCHYAVQNVVLQSMFLFYVPYSFCVIKMTLDASVAGDI